ncbi:DUF3999 family protein [Chondrinema litorale]|uniref:DUF3999 family protein n=1 Tax=Chondrinema litorale TaxID=2994555 RepID=UPI002543482C|nr:DUF3999 family protein [Chondrinema litorale]UZR98771.1 DUF3999 family protein [Chondrinema litorale]
MKWKVKSCFTAMLLLMVSSIFAQIDQFSYKRKLSGISNQWHNMELPDEMFTKLNENLSDIRIYGVSEGNDTIEAPYILKLKSDQLEVNEVSFEVINQAKNGQNYFYTLEIPGSKKVNRIVLDFGQSNFDWKVKLEGSQNQQQWFTVLEDYRIMSIKNNLTDYKFTRLSFPAAKYKYFRLQVPAKEKPELLTAKVSFNELVEGEYRDYKIESFKVTENKEQKQTVLEVKLSQQVPVSYIKFNIKDEFDYYRNMRLQYQTDRFNTDKGWKYNYSSVKTGVLSSIENNEFKFQNIVTQQLKVIVENYDNEPLNISSVEVKGNVYELLGRFTKPAEYYLVYGQEYLSSPEYDIARFEENVPEDLQSINLGSEEIIPKEQPEPVSPLFISKTWLWAIMLIIIAVLGWFSVRMMKSS